MGLILRLKRMGKLATLMILSFTFSLTVLNTTLTQYKGLLTSKKVFSSMFDLNNTYLFRLVPQTNNEGTVYNREKQEKDLKNAYERVDELKEKGLIYNHMIYAPASLGRGEILDYSIYENNKGNEEFMKNKRSISMDKSLWDRMDLKIKEGRGFKEEDFLNINENDVVPIIVGWKQMVNVGDTIGKNIMIGEELRSVKCEVVGIYEEGEVPIVDVKDYEHGGFTTYFGDEFTIFPVIKNSTLDSSTSILGSFGMFFELREGISPERVVNELNSIADDGLTAKFFSLNDGVKSFVDSSSIDGNTSLVLGIILVILSLVGGITILMGHLARRKKELGVKQALGASVGIIFKEVAKDSFFIVIVSSLLSLYFVFCITKYILPPWLIFFNIALAVLMALIISIIPVYKLCSISIVELMKKKI